MVPVLRDAGLSALIESDELETLATGLVFTEGPLGLPDGSVLFQDIKAERTYRLPPGGGPPALLRDRTRAANGQTFDRDGRLIFCEQNGRRMSRMAPDGTGVVTAVESWEGKRLNSPNDVVARSDGSVYFTDPPYGVTPEAKELPFQAVFRIGPDGSLRPVVDDFEKPNGLAFSPDERTLYVCDTAKYHVRAFDIAADGSLDLASGRVFAAQDPAEKGGPDGMKIDQSGRVYVAVAEGAWVYEPGGRLLGILHLPKRPSNLAWCGPDARDLVITAVDSVYRVRMRVAGVRPVFQPAAGG
jgi:gluconolactonase